MEIFYSIGISLIVGLTGGWLLASVRPTLGTKVAKMLIRIGDIKKVNSQLFPELYVTVGATSTGLLSFLLPLSIHNIKGIVVFQSLPDGERWIYQGLRWLNIGLDTRCIDIALPGEYELVIATDDHGVLYPGDDIGAGGGRPLSATFNVTVQILGPTNEVIANRTFQRAITDGKLN